MRRSAILRSAGISTATAESDITRVPAVDRRVAHDAVEYGHADGVCLGEQRGHAGAGRLSTATARPTSRCFGHRTGRGTVVPSTTGVAYGFAWGERCGHPGAGRLRRRRQDRHRGVPAVERHVVRPAVDDGRAVWRMTWGNSGGHPRAGRLRRRREDRHRGVPAVERARWYVVPSTTGVPYAYGWGNAADTPVPGDYDGDGKDGHRRVPAVERHVVRRALDDGRAVRVRVGERRGHRRCRATTTATGRRTSPCSGRRTGSWYVVPSTTGVPYGFAWGNDADVPILKRP